MEVRENYFYTKDHEWVRVEDGIAYVGITDYAQSELGEIVFVDIEVGAELAQFEEFGSIEAVKTVADLNMPVSGVIEEINPELESKPELINTDPYGEGYIARITLANEDELSNLMTAKEYEEFLINA